MSKGGCWARHPAKNLRWVFICARAQKKTHILSWSTRWQIRGKRHQIAAHAQSQPSTNRPLLAANGSKTPKKKTAGATQGFKQARQSQRQHFFAPRSQLRALPPPTGPRARWAGAQRMLGPPRRPPTTTRERRSRLLHRQGSPPSRAPCPAPPCGASAVAE